MNGIPHSQLAPLPSQAPFRIVSPTIGSGAYACIKKAAPLQTDSPVFAVKFINKLFAQKYGRIKQKQLEMEISLHKHLGLHKNIVEFFDHGADQDWVWIAMELAEGGDLFDKIEADAGVPQDIAHVYFTQLISAIGYMHAKGVAHRDIKPENVLLSAEGDLKIADFGMATLFEYAGRRKLATTLCGSPPYVAPEVLCCSTQSGTKGTGYAADMADIWSCGVVLFVLLAGNTPWSRPVEGRDEYGRQNEYSEYISSNGRPKDELWDTLPSEVLSLLRGMMRVDVKSRFSLEDVRRHPWFTRPNKFMDQKGKLSDPITMATNMFEALHVSFDADPFASTQRHVSADDMDIDGPAAKLASTQPEVPSEDMLFDWKRPTDFAGSNTQIVSRAGGFATQSISTTNFLFDEPATQQFSQRPSVPLSRTQMARKFGDILPAHGLTKFYSTWALHLLFPYVLEALSRLGVPTPSASRPTAQDSECRIKVKTQDNRGCPLRGEIAIELVDDGLVEVCFVKASGDPLEWRRFFKRMAVLCQDAVFRPEV
ncbi:Chk1 protein kinase [Exophiala xenobiotica]|uniref:non-specific serine/threonine protein kinase n=1 Tax=Vermiconidia calcicola TaxID=1690605 RepID=A0AAV9Q014_9PEZI|nr:Chk1 protein kinase [Exophiala xenobiotica]KAK5530913.1 Chk1 protein kinase [Vermiconidia calcicola]KAK5544405.1 Chk1 protein kinase [Chaetothyriales sp. CCFEE 6169]KAK5269030.1 Chk1 protein kinase [Exophiala xenobiotica]KAK5294606.1 Chk1 protein kinase [Exophiala xenobiotica]